MTSSDTAPVPAPIGGAIIDRGSGDPREVVAAPGEVSAPSPRADALERGRIDRGLATIRAHAGLVLLALILVAGGVLRFQGLGNHCLWFDEALTWRFLDFSWREMLERLEEPGESHPPLYYIALRGWSAAWGDSEFALRSFAALAGVITVVLAYPWVREVVLLGTSEPGAEEESAARRSALLATALVALNVTQVHASRQARMYSLGTALLLAESWMLVRALRGGPDRRRSWILFGVAALPFCYTHALAVVALASQALFVLAYLALGPDSRRRRAGPTAEAVPEDGEARQERLRPGASLSRSRSRSQWAWGIGVAVVLGVCCLPLVSLLKAKAEGVTWTIPFDFEEVPRETALTLLSTFAVPLEFGSPGTWLLTAGLFAVLGRLLARGGWPGRYLALTGLGPVFLMVGYSYATDRSIYFSRYLTFVQIAWLAALSVSAIGLRRKARGLAIVGLGLLSLAVSVRGPLAWVESRGNPGMRAAVEHVLERRRPGEVILAQRPISLIKAVYYLRGRARPLLWTTVPSRHLQAQSTWLRDEELISSADVLALEVPGVWVISTSWPDETREITFPMPGDWKLLEIRTFPQDYPVDGPVLVYHFGIGG